MLFISGKVRVSYLLLGSSIPMREFGGGRVVGERRKQGGEVFGIQPKRGPWFHQCGAGEKASVFWKGQMGWPA